MSKEKRKTVVNSWNEWGPLKHVIVGRATGTMVQAPEPAMERDARKPRDQGRPPHPSRFPPGGANAGLGAEIHVRLHASQRSSVDRG